jgi:hypothetical protein
MQSIGCYKKGIAIQQTKKKKKQLLYPFQTNDYTTLKLDFTCTLSSQLLLPSKAHRTITLHSVCVTMWVCVQAET